MMHLQKLLQHEQVAAHHSKSEPGNITNMSIVHVMIVSSKYNLKSNIEPKVNLRRVLLTTIPIVKCLGEAQGVDSEQSM